MESLAVPLRVQRTGRLQRADRIDAVIAILSSMLITESKLWPEAPWFGLLEVVQSLNLQLTDQGLLRDALNTALQQLDITWISVDAVVLTRGSLESGGVHFDLTLSLTDNDSVVFRQLAV